MKKHGKTGVCLRTLRYALMLFVSITITFTAQAQDSGFAGTPCDPAYFDTLKSRAWLEAQREITQNQNIITKPDSVLELTCFDKYGNLLAKEAQANLFSETQEWGPIRGLPPLPYSGFMEKALDKAIAPSIMSYIAANFGKAGYSSGPIQIGGYSCSMMNSLWSAAKCGNFADGSGQGFFTLAEYASGGDKRSCASAGGWTVNYPTATGVGAPSDPLKSYASITAGGECSASVKVPTGVEVIHTGAAYQEYICLTPGCAYIDKECQ